MSFKIIRNDITKVRADAIVNTANPHPVIGSGTDSIDDDELSERGKLAVSLVTLMGNAIAESEGYLNEYDEG